MILGAVTKIYKVNSTVLGQDRMIRTYTFLLRVIKLHLLKKIKSGECLRMWQNKLDLLCSHFSMTRRILRWSRTAFYLQILFNKLSQQKSNNVLKYNRNLFDILFYTYLIITDISDLIYWMCQIGLCNNMNLHQFTKKYAPKFYFIECIGWFISLCFEYRVNQIDIAKANLQNDPKNKIRIRQIQILQNLVKYGLDIPVSYSYVNTQAIKQETAVILGTFSSFISLYQTFQLHSGGYQ
ncbi:unnamed protein product [Paramecium pentaurelia]|uniref:Peroxisomal biogenesis factor 11 n=1 Tax=Paramecium pentaurelia TaxID=43138 RepID=A0A8S1VSB3_9CILI|nr:unnamed protein product [Paramecium pentaurelia]